MVRIAKWKGGPLQSALSRRIPKLKVAALLLLFVLVFFLGPVVPYFQSVSVPGAYQSGLSACLAGVTRTNFTLADEQELSCEQEFRSPSVNLYGFATPSYGLLGYGSPPFPDQELVTQGNHSALVFFNGGEVAALEDVGAAGVMVQPNGVVEIMSAAVSSSDFGFLNITVRLRNIGVSSVTDPTVWVSMKGFSTNGSMAGLPLLVPKFLGSCGTTWNASAYCSVSQEAANNLPVNESVSFGVEVRGDVRGAPFVYRQAFEEDYPRGGVGPYWVSDFIQQVDESRGGVTLTENSTLDRFAELRFRDASTVYQVSDYGLSTDASSFFGPRWNTSQIEEVLLYPSFYTPKYYAEFLSGYALDHWEALTNEVDRQFGYYVGQSLYYEVSVPCSVYEIPRAGVNIAQFFENAGCRTTVASVTWLVMILTP